MGTEKPENEKLQHQIDKEAQIFYNRYVLGKYISKIIYCRKNSEKFDMRLNGDEPLIADEKVYLFIQEFAQWFKRVPSCVIYKKILNREVEISFLENSKTIKEFSHSIDRFYNGSAEKFESDMLDILKEVLELYDVWIEMEDKYFSKQGFIDLKGQELK